MMFMLSLHENLIKQISPHLDCRNQDLKQRKVYVKLYDDVTDAGGDVKIFSSMHVSGERKCQKGVADLWCIAWSDGKAWCSCTQSVKKTPKTDTKSSSPQNSHS